MSLTSDIQFGLFLVSMAFIVLLIEKGFKDPSFKGVLMFIMCLVPGCYLICADLTKQYHSIDTYDVELHNNSSHKLTIIVFGKPKKEFNYGNYQPGDWENNSGIAKVKPNTSMHLASTLNDSLMLKDLGFQSIKIISKRDTIYKSGEEMLALFKKNHSGPKPFWELSVNDKIR